MTRKRTDGKEATDVGHDDLLFFRELFADSGSYWSFTGMARYRVIQKDNDYKEYLTLVRHDKVTACRSLLMTPKVAQKNPTQRADPNIINLPAPVDCDKVEDTGGAMAGE